MEQKEYLKKLHQSGFLPVHNNVILEIKIKYSELNLKNMDFV